MAQEENKDRFYDSRFGSFEGFGGINNVRSSKKPKPKPKKVPQRGLGVAQLEKIRLEEQQKNDSNSPPIFSSSPSPMSPTKSSSLLSLPIPNFHQSKRSSSSSSFPSPPHMNLSASGSIFGPPLPVLNMSVRNSSTVPLVNQENSGGSETGLSAITVLEQGNALKWPNSFDYFLEENYGVDPELAFRANFDFPYEVNPSWPSSELLQRTQQYQSLSPMVNIPSTTSFSSGLNVQIEPPSNQSYYYGNYSTIWEDKQEKIHNHRWQSIPSKCRGDDAPSSLTYTLAPSSFGNIKEDNSNGGNFLSHASVTNRWTNASSNNIKCPATYPLLQNLMHADSESLPFQGGINPTRGFNEKQQPFYSFLPPAEARIGQETAISVNKCNSEMGERVDLDLKL